MKKALVLLLVVHFAHVAAIAQVAKESSPENIVASLKQLRTELQWPGMTADEAVANLKTPQEALRFVRDDIMLINYRGSYAGPEGILRTRVGNATDKAYLLAILLQKMKVKVRMARADWPEGAVPHQGPGPRRPLPTLAKLSDLLGAATIKPSAATQSLTDKQLQALRDEIKASADVIEKHLATNGRGDLLKGVPAPETIEPTRVDTDWVWAQAKLDGKTWTDMDPVFPKHPRPAKVKAPFGFMPVAITVRLEAISAGQKKPEQLLQFSTSTHKVIGHDLVLTYFPASGNIKAAEQPEKVARWRPVLNCGSVKVAGKEFAPSGGPAKASDEKPKPSGGGGFGGLFGGRKKPAPKPAAGGYDALRLVIEFAESGDPKSPSASYSRVVQYIGDGYDANELIAVHRIAMGLGFIPVRVVESRMVDEVLDAFGLRRMAEKGEKAAKTGPPRGYSSRTTKVLNSMFFLKHLLAPPQLKLGWKGPAVFIETYQLRKVDGKIYFASRLDTLHESFGPGPGASRRERLLWGLATAAIEAHLLKTTSVNRSLLAAGETLRVVGKEGPARKGRLDGEAIQKGVLDSGGLLLASNDAPDSVWAIRPTGDLLGVFVDVRSGTAAKGAGARARSEAAGNAFAALGDGAMSALGCPAGMLISPLQQYFQELAKAYYKAASVLDRLSKTIETGDDSHMKGQEDDYFKNLGRHLTNALVRGFVKGWAENAAGAGIGRVLGSGGRNPMTDRVIDGLVATDLSLPPEVPGFTPVVERAMDAVTIPPE
jgi:hypothetical protein